MNTDNDSGGRPVAVVHAEIGGDAWRSVGHVQRSTTSDHSDWYAITGEMAETLRCIAAVASVLGRQVRTYREGRVLRDDAGMDPTERADRAWSLASRLRADIDRAERTANEFWSEISHIAVEDPS